MNEQQTLTAFFSTILSLFLVAGAGFADDLTGTLPDPDGKPADMSRPVKVFILLGQSNMLGFGKVAGGEKSLEHAVKNKGLYPYLVDDDGNWTTRKDVRNVRVMNFKDYKNEWMTISGRNIGPEIGIGHHVGQVLDEPVMILKSCIGNRSLGWDLLPPGSEPYEYNGKTEPGYRGTPDDPRGNGEKVEGKWYAGKQYDDDVDSAKQVLANLDKYYPGAKAYEVAGFCFWQGAKDGGNPAHADRYEQNLVQFIKALRKDFDAPAALFVIATMGHGIKGSGGNAGKITDAQLAVDGSTGNYPEFKGNVATFYSNPVSKGGSANGHYGGHAETYMNVGEGMGKAMAALLKLAGAGGTAISPAALSRKARTLSSEHAARLHRALTTELKTLDASGKLKPLPIRLSGATSKAVLIAVPDAETLSFRSVSGRTAKIPISNLKASDMANLAQLAVKLDPDNKTAQALLGVYYEGFGRVAEAEKRYALAGPAARQKINQFFRSLKITLDATPVDLWLLLRLPRQPLEKRAALDLTSRLK